MRLQASREALAGAVAAAARTLPARPAIPAAAALLLEILDQNRLLITGTDTDTTTKTLVTLESSSTGSVLVPGAVLSELLKDLPNGTVTLEVADGQLNVTASCGSYKIPVIASDPVPAPKLPEPHGSVDGAALQRAVAAVASAADRTDANLGTIRLEIRDTKMRFVATDRYRLGVAEIAYTPADGAQNISVQIPARSLLDAAKTVSRQGEIRVSVGETNVGFSSSQAAVIIRQAAVQFPKYETLLERGAVADVNVDADMLTGAVRRVGRFGSQRVEVAFGDGKLTVTSPGSELGTATETIPVQWPAEEALSVLVNAAYLADAVNATGAATVKLSPTGTSTAMKVSAGESDPFHLVMPLRG